MRKHIFINCVSTVHNTKYDLQAYQIDWDRNIFT